MFLASRRHLPYLIQHQLIQPIDQLLDDRGVDFGDDYPRSTLTAFGSRQPPGLPPVRRRSPSVIFYNKRLVKLGQVSNDPPSPGEGWSLDQFAAAARWAVQPPPGHRRASTSTRPVRHRAVRVLRGRRALRRRHRPDHADALRATPTSSR